ncbi:type II toxin-antitoxin system PemK/MazF family toxin [Synechocystis salina LEGE 06155]|nr:type II toxin-antitoxin system PemK/MazF family toxin [Synechocystis salina LEGE 06155]
MKRGEIYYANLNSTVGSEIAKHRPVLIVSNDINNRAANTVTVLPITSNVTKVYPFEVFLDENSTQLPKSCKVQAQQIRTISKQRMDGRLVSVLSSDLMKLVDAAIALHLGL